MGLPKGRHKFVIRYESGQNVEVTADSLTVSRSTVDSSIVEMKWVNLWPKPLFLGLDHIESVWQEA